MHMTNLCEFVQNRPLDSFYLCVLVFYVWRNKDLYTHM